MARRTERGLRLEHLYVRPGCQGQGIGATVLHQVFGEADALGLELSVGAPRESDSNRFYQRHGFVRVAESEWDIHYVRGARGADGGSSG